PISSNALLSRADGRAIGAEDVAGGAPPIRKLLQPGQELLVTHGPRGALHLQLDGIDLRGRYMPPLPVREAVDTTGAGDTFLAAWLATRMLVGTDWRALAVAAAMASLSVRRQAIHETPTLSELCEVLVRLRDGHLG
ncbi:MAG: PfkB family carbohydrate kinase, partial [Candidatus Limnocylindrales bacterium]